MHVAKIPDEAKGAGFYSIAAISFMSVLLLITNLPDRATAERLGDMLVEKRLAACVNILAPCRSVYRWKGAIQHDEEHPMLIKTTPERYQALQEALREGHPYELPEIIAVPVERGLPEYLQWVADETRAETKA
jgi:periplasmic divalent cation tolerance protein